MRGCCRLILATLMLVGGFAIGARPAQAQTIPGKPADASRAPVLAPVLMNDFSMAEMRKIIENTGPEVLELKTASSGPELTAKTKAGLNFAIFGFECSGTGDAQRCRGAEMSANFNLGSKIGVQKAIDAINYAAVAIGSAGEGRLKITRYVIFDRGITDQNMKTNLEVFLGISTKVWDRLIRDGYFKFKDE